MTHRGDFDPAAVVYGKFTTYRPSTGAPFTLAGSPAISVYKDGSATQSTTGVTLTADFDSVTGLNHFAIDTSADGTFYSAGSFFDLVLTAGSVDSVSVVGSVVASFSLRKTSSLKPTTVGRTLDVSAGGEAGIDWANIGSPTTAVNLSGTNIDVDQVVASVSGAVGSVAANGITASSLASDAGSEVATAVWAAATRELTSGTNIALAKGTGVTGFNDLSAAAVNAEVDTAISDAALATAANLTTVAGYLDTEITAIKAKTDLIPAAPAATGDIPSAATIADAVWDEAVDGTTTARQSIRLANAGLGGKASGLETTAAVYRDLADTKDRITATVDVNGNRTAVTVDLT